MAGKKKHKTKISAAKYVEKVSSQIFDRYQKEVTNMIKKYLESLQKQLPVLKKRIKNDMRGEFEKSFRLTSFDRIRSSLKKPSTLEEWLKNDIKQDIEKSFRLMSLDKMQTSKKLLPALKKCVENAIRQEIDESFKVVPSGQIKKGKRPKVKK